MAVEVNETRLIVPDPERYSRNHNMRTQEIGRGGQKVYPKHELLNEAHNRGLVGIELTPLTSPIEDEYIFLAQVTFADGTTFEDIGDASPRNCNNTTATALPRMAATRAISRAIALAINADTNVDVEMPDGGGPAPRRQPARSSGNTNYQPSRGGGGDPDWEDE